MRLRLVPLVLSFAVAAPVAAEIVPAPGPGDSRLQTVLYDPDQVVVLRVATGYALTLELAADERIENIVVGNIAVWQVTPSKRGDHLFVKPLQGATPTNMEVISDARHYSFELQPAAGGQAPFTVRFRYASVPPQVETIVSPSPPATYRLRGQKALLPAFIGDDGERTTMRWPPRVALPAVYAVDDRGREAIVNGRMVNGGYVVEAIAPRFVFRAGDREASATRQVPKEHR